MRHISVVTKVTMVYAVLVVMIVGLAAPVVFAVENGGVTVNDAGIGSAESVQDSSTSSRPKIIDDFLDATDLSTLSSKSVAWSVVHASLLVVGLVLAIFASRSYSWAFGNRQTTSKQNVLTRLGGAILIIAAFII